MSTGTKKKSKTSFNGKVSAAQKRRAKIAKARDARKDQSIPF